MKYLANVQIKTDLGTGETSVYWEIIEQIKASKGMWLYFRTWEVRRTDAEFLLIKYPEIVTILE